MARPQGPAPGGICQARSAWPDRAEFLGVQPGLGGGPEPACLGCGVGRRHRQWHDGRGGGRQGVQVDRGDLCQIPDGAELIGPPGGRVRRALCELLRPLPRPDEMVEPAARTRRGEIVGPSKKFRPQRVFGANRKEHRHDHQSDQAFIAAQLARGGRGGQPGAALCRQRRGHDRDGVVGARVCAGGGRMPSRRSSPITRRRAATRSTTASVPYAPHAPKGDLGDHQRRGPGPDPGEPRRSRRGLCLAGQARRRQRRRRDPEGAIQRHRAAVGAVLQQRHQAAQLLWRALYRRDPAVPHLEFAGRERRATSWRTSPRPGTPIATSSSRCRTSCARRACATSTGSVCRSRPTATIPNNVFNYFLIAYGGKDIVTQDGKLHLDDPKVKEAAIKALTIRRPPTRKASCRSSAINWNDADDNNAFHAKSIVMDLDGTISTEVALIKDKEDYDDIVTQGLPLDNDGKPVPSQVTACRRDDPEGRQKCRGRQGFPEVPDPAEGHERLT